MFTGLVTSIGTIENCRKLKESVRLCISADCGLKTIEIGASISCSGICLTVVDLPTKRDGTRWFTVEAWEEALRLTTLLSWDVGTRINLERSLKLGDEMGGHLVSGHIDNVAKILSVQDEGYARRFKIRVPMHLAPFIAPKGSVCLDGTSLTVNYVDGNTFNVLLIRHTLDVTTWDERKPGDDVNIEIDQLARYAGRFTEFA
ncbi:MAG: riboflavin synthase [Candidatus Tokpelaia sp. JSC189]|nr:MAG: riboflavin synthase [Candidatus Tokpelaia sp. JSC189]